MPLAGTQCRFQRCECHDFWHLQLSTNATGFLPKARRNDGVAAWGSDADCKLFSDSFELTWYFSNFLSLISPTPARQPIFSYIEAMAKVLYPSRSAWQSAKWRVGIELIDQ
ncbi:hypothetical protein [Undibacterium sp. CCC3.4]|nr:hypothetical protein [Undibacterium sp. CCC3.4]MEB0177157.1 hypothetical protein [Undibacterium sp. CCC3.4]